MTNSGLETFLRSRRLNALLGWALVGLLVAISAGSLLRGDLLWSGFTLAVAALAAVPAIAYREPTAMLPWEVLLIASLPLLGRALVAGQTIGNVRLTGRLATYFAVAAVALIIAVELDLFTPVRMTRTFAVVFVAIATTASAGVWAEVRWLSDLLFGTAFILDGRPESVIETALMWDFVAATLVGLGIGVVFEFYVRRRSNAPERVPDGLSEVE